MMRRLATPGLSSLPRRVGSTLKRKFWDSNDLVSSTAGRWGRMKGGREGGKDKGRTCCTNLIYIPSLPPSLQSKHETFWRRST